MFGEVALDSRTGKRSSFEESLRNIVEEGKLAEKVGVDLIALGNITVKNILSQVQNITGCFSSCHGGKLS